MCFHECESLRLDANQVNAVAQSWLEIVSGFNPDIPHIRAGKLCKIKNQQKTTESSY